MIKVHKEVIKGTEGDKECRFHIFSDNEGLNQLSEKDAIFIYTQLKEYLIEEKLIK